MIWKTKFMLEGHGRRFKRRRATKAKRDKAKAKARRVMQRKSRRRNRL